VLVDGKAEVGKLAAHNAALFAPPHQHVEAGEVEVQERFGRQVLQRARDVRDHLQTAAQAERKRRADLVRVMQQIVQAADEVGHSAQVVACLRCARQHKIVGCRREGETQCRSLTAYNPSLSSTCQQSPSVMPTSWVTQAHPAVAIGDADELGNAGAPDHPHLNVSETMEAHIDFRMPDAIPFIATLAPP
jgi:hypothetical protein